MIVRKKTFKQFIIIFLLSTFFSLTVFSQVTTQQLDNFYKKNQKQELEQIFITFYNQAKTEFSKLSDNDTLKKINEIFNIILPEQQKSATAHYFFLQSFFPRTFIGTKELLFKRNFIASTTIENLRPIRYDYQTINEILKFIGANPYDNPTVNKYVEDKEKLKKSKQKKAERLIAEYNNKTKFIGQFLFLPATWGTMDRSLVPYKINSIKFNSDLTVVEISYDFTSNGATKIYRLLNGKWKQERTIMEWVH